MQGNNKNALSTFYDFLAEKKLIAPSCKNAKARKPKAKAQNLVKSKRQGKQFADEMTTVTPDTRSEKSADESKS